MDNLTIETFDSILADYFAQLENSTDQTQMLRLQGAIQAIRALKAYAFRPLSVEEEVPVEASEE